MRRKHHRWRTVLVLLLGLLVPATASAGPYFGDWSWCWKPGKDCPRGDYCFLHYWTPQLYRVCYCVHPANIDQYPPGLGLPPGYQFDLHPCRTAPPSPTSPYAGPAAYYGRPIVPPPEEAKEKK
jgi:hypothetical protein